MGIALESVGTFLLGFAAWLVGLHIFDSVHWVLHKMLRSRRRLLRLLATPHALHHAWLDGQLHTHPELQTKNFWGHIVLEYATQLAFSALLLLVLPPSAVAVCVVFQTIVFAYIASTRGADLNHRPGELVDAYAPSPIPLPSYHALHHAYPDAYFSAYTKLVDYAVGGGIQIAGRRFAVVGDNAFGRELGSQLRRAGGEVGATREVTAAPDLRACDVLVLADPAAERIRPIETFVAAVGDRRLPPEVWAVYTRPPDANARHYYRDPRVGYRVLTVSDEDLRDPVAARRAVRRVMFFALRGFHFVSSDGALASYRAFQRFRGLAPQAPAGVPQVRWRSKLYGSAAKADYATDGETLRGAIR